MTGVDGATGGGPTDSQAPSGGLLFESVSYRFRSRGRGATDALHDFHLACGRGSTVCMIGPNGAGKSTALALAAGLIGTGSGRICFAEQVITPLTPPGRLGYLPQASAFPGVLTVAEVLALAFELRGTPGTEQDIVTRVAGLAPALSSPIRTLSSGWVRRLGLALALTPPTDLLLLDEPFVGLDIETLDRIVEHLRQRRQEGTTILLASHDYETVDRLEPRIVVLREGRTLGDAAAGEARASYRRIVASVEAERAGDAPVEPAREGVDHAVP